MTLSIAPRWVPSRQADAEQWQEADGMALQVGGDLDHDQSLNRRRGAGLMTR